VEGTMNIDKTTFIGYMQAVSAILMVAGVNILDDPATQLKLWEAWAILVSLLGALKGKWSKTDDGLIDPTRALQMDSIAEDIKTKQVERTIMIREYNAKVKEGKA